MKTFLNKNLNKNKNEYFLVLAGLLNLFLNYQLFNNNLSVILVFIWFASLISLIVPSASEHLEKKKKEQKQFRSKTFWEKVAFFLLLISPSLVRIGNYNLTRLHGDEFLTAYFSANYDFKKDNFFAPVPRFEGEWVCQFPSLYFILQKIFFLLFKENSLTVKLSTLPYVPIISTMLFLITKKILNKESAIIAVILYSFFSASLYLETLGLHFISSSAVFLIFFYFLVYDSKNNLTSVLSGIFCGFCYLFYTSSYIALPILVFFYLTQLIYKRRVIILKNFLLALTGVSLVISPFLIYPLKTKKFYFTERIDQVNLLSGTWANTDDLLKQGKTLSQIIKSNFFLSFSSLYKDGVGGHGGYDFGRQAMFEKVSLVLFVLGSTVSLLFLFKNPTIIWVWVVIIISFLTGVVFTLPPPALHRFSIAFPFLILISTLPFYLVLKLKKVNRYLPYLIIIPAVLLYCLNGQRYFNKISAAENNNAAVELIKFIETNYPGRNIYVAAFPSFIFEKEFYFLKKRDSRQKIITKYHDDFLNNFNVKEKYVYVIIFPEGYDEKFKAADPNGKIIKFSRDYSLFVN